MPNFNFDDLDDMDDLMIDDLIEEGESHEGSEKDAKVDQLDVGKMNGKENSNNIQLNVYNSMNFQNEK